MTTSDGARPFISFLAPAFRTERYLSEAIDSVMAQSRPDWELVVVDNGMSEKVARIVGRYAADSRITLLRQENSGVGGGVDAAAAAATGRYFTVLLTDDLVVPEFCERVSGFLEANPSVDAVGCDAWMFDESSGQRQSRTMYQVRGLRVEPSHRITLTEYLGGPLFSAHATVRRSAWTAVGGFTSEPTKVEDLSLWLRLLGDGYDVRAIPDVLVGVRERADSVSATNVTAVLRAREHHMLAAARRSGSPADMAAADSTLRRFRHAEELKLARLALQASDFPLARRHASRALGARQTARAGLAWAGLLLAPGLLKRAHSVRHRFIAAVRYLGRHLPAAVRVGSR